MISIRPAAHSVPIHADIDAEIWLSIESSLEHLYKPENQEALIQHVKKEHFRDLTLHQFSTVLASWADNLLHVYKPPQGLLDFIAALKSQGWRQLEVLKSWPGNVKIENFDPLWAKKLGQIDSNQKNFCKKFDLCRAWIDANRFMYEWNRVFRKLCLNIGEKEWNIDSLSAIQAIREEPLLWKGISSSMKIHCAASLLKWYLKGYKKDPETSRCFKPHILPLLEERVEDLKLLSPVVWVLETHAEDFSQALEKMPAGLLISILKYQISKYGITISKPLNDSLIKNDLEILKKEVRQSSLGEQSKKYLESCIDQLMVEKTKLLFLLAVESGWSS